MPTAIVTGSGRGIGRETAILLARKGVNVVVCSRTEKEVAETVNLIRLQGNVLGIKCDVSVSSDVDNLVKQTVRHFGTVDILVNNAGVLVVKPMMETSEEEWDEIMDCNLKSAFLCSKTVLPHMIARNSGTIINVSSGAGKTGFENLSAYCASKFGMMGLTESLAWEVASHRIRVMAICPGEVDTKMQDFDPEYHEANRHTMLRPQQVASRIADMIFDHRFHNGQSIDI